MIYCNWYIINSQYIYEYQEFFMVFKKFFYKIREAVNNELGKCTD